MFDWTNNNKRDKEVEKAEIELLRYISNWIHTKLKLNSQITQNDIDADFDVYNAPVVYDGLKALEDVDIIYSDTVFNPEENRTEKIFYSKKMIV
jgi:hypothetical protein